MKVNIRFGILLAVAFIGHSVTSYGQSTKKKNTVDIPDSTTSLSDPFWDYGDTERNDMPALRTINPRLVKAISAYTEVLGKVGNSNVVQDNIAQLTVKGGKAKVYGVPDTATLNTYCTPAGPRFYKLASGTKVEQVACTTTSREYYIVETVFASLTLREQALLFVHETISMIRDTSGGKYFIEAAQIANGLKIAGDLLNEQATNKYRNLTATEISTMTDFYNALEALKYLQTPNATIPTWTAHPYGGGRVHENAVVDPTALLDVTSAAGEDSDIGANSQVIRVSTGEKGKASSLKLGTGAILKNTTVGNYGVTLGDGASAIDTNFKDGTTAELGKGSSISASSVFAELKVGDYAQIKNTQFYQTTVTFGDHAVVTDSEFTQGIFTTGTHFVFEKSKMSGQGRIGIRNNVEFRDSNVNSFTDMPDIASNQKLSGVTISEESLGYSFSNVAPVSFSASWTKNLGKGKEVHVDSTINRCFKSPNLNMQASPGVSVTASVSKLSAGKHYVTAYKLQLSIQPQLETRPIYGVDAQGTVRKVTYPKQFTLTNNYCDDRSEDVSKGEVVNWIIGNIFDSPEVIDKLIVSTSHEKTWSYDPIIQFKAK